jgi:deoxyribodipyrimidine photo-lyase
MSRGAASHSADGCDGAAIVWFRQDLRLRNNPALHAAATSGGPVIPLYIWSPEEEGDWPPGAASRWWLHHSLRALDEELRERGSRLILARGPALRVLKKLVADTGANAVYWNKRYEPAALAGARRVSEGLQHARRRSLRTAELTGSLLVEPTELLSKGGQPYRVYTAFQRTLFREIRPRTLLPAPRKLRAPRAWPASRSLESLELLPGVKWYTTMEATWRPGEAGAHAALRQFLKGPVTDYERARELPALRGTSRLSPHLHFGEIDPQQVWQSLRAAGGNPTYLREIAWREFAYHLLYHFPESPDRPLQAQFEQFPWRNQPRLLRAWQRGMTGIPLVDAGMRELWATGWMHNRIRMVTASFLVKNLLIQWQQGARWFWDTLVDADQANNTLNWQWVAGCGADAAPYFRIFNAELQARRFDPHNTYVARWVREEDHPMPVVDLKATREAALDAYARMRRVARGGPEGG